MTRTRTARPAAVQLSAVRRAVARPAAGGTAAVRPTAVRAALPALLVAALAAVLPVVLAVGVTAASGRLGVPTVSPAGVADRVIPAARAARLVLLTATLGCLLTAVWAVPDPSGDRWALTGLRRRVVAVGAALAALWALAEVVLGAATFVQESGAGPAPGELAAFAVHVELGRIAVVGVLAAVVAAHLAAFATRVGTVLAAAAAVLAAAAAGALGGQAVPADDHMNGANSSLALLLATGTWVGGLGVLLVARGSDPGAAVALARWRRVSACCAPVAVLAAFDLVSLRLAGPRDLAGPFGGAALVALALLAAAAAIAVRTAVRGSAAAQVLLVSAAAGVAVALAGLLPPRPEATRTGVVQNVRTLVGFSPPPPMSPAALLSEWYPDWLAVGAAAALAGAYAVGARRVPGWPRWRTAVLVAGCAVAVWATGGGPAVYGRVDFRGHMLAHMLLLLVVPPLLVAGRPGALLFRAVTPRTDASTGPVELLQWLGRSRASRALTHPVLAGAVFLGGYALFYGTGVLEPALATHTGHMAATAFFLATGLLFARAVLGPGDAGPAADVGADAGAAAGAPLRLVVLLVVMAGHTAVELVLVSTGRLLAAGWWPQLGLTDPGVLLGRQHDGALLGWVVGDLAGIGLAVAVVLGWYRGADAAAGPLPHPDDRGRRWR